MNESTASEGKANESQDFDDKDFVPPPEAMADIDDEQTLEEEEALNGSVGPSVQEEINNLKKESEMPIEDVLAHYERLRDEAKAEGDDDNEDEEEEEDDDYDEEDDDDDEEEDDDMGEEDDKDEDD